MQVSETTRCDAEWLHQSKLIVFVLCAGVFMLLCRIAYQLAAPPLPDEAYYWLWGQRFDWSYYDHPPLQAWMQRAVRMMGFDGLFGLRVLPTLVSSAVLVWALVFVLGRQDVTGQKMLVVLAVSFASPVVFIFTMLVFPDHLMLALLALAFVAARQVLTALDGHNAPHPLHIVSVGLCLGLAMLTKYNAALVGLAFVAVVFWYPSYRVLLRNPWLYLAVLIAILCLVPVFWWNTQQQAASFQYNFNTRLQYVPDRILGNILGYVAGALGAFSVFLVPALLRVLRQTPTDATRRIAVAAFIIPSVIWLAATSVTNVVYYWNIIAYLFILPFAVMAVRKAWVVVFHMIFGLVLSVGLLVNYTLAPMSVVMGQPIDHESALVYGWDILVPRLKILSAEKGAPRLVASDYRYGSLMAWYTRDLSVEVYSMRKSQFDIWQGREQRPRQAAIILTSNEYPLSQILTEQFSDVTHLEQHVIERHGSAVVTWDVWLGTVQ